MMGNGQVLNHSNAHHHQNIPSHVSDWLQSSRPFHTLTKDQTWSSQQPKIKNDIDEQSTTSVDDSVSVSDSNHESWSSSSSTFTGSTTGTDPADFSDHEDREQHPSTNWYKGPAPTRFPEESAQECAGRKLSDQWSNDYNAWLSQRTTPKTTDTDDASAQPTIRSVRSETLRPPQKPCEALSNSASRSQFVADIVQKCNSRRTSCSKSTQSPPCKLTRDTDCTDHFVTLLIIFATRLITAIWPLSACPPMMSTSFNGAGVLPLRVFIQETLKRSRASYSTLQVALFYLILLKARLPAKSASPGLSNGSCSRESPEKKACRAMQCGRRMFLSALMLASKYLQDRNYSARAWSKISGLRSNEINDNERDYLARIDYSLHVPKETFDNWSKIVISLSKLANKSPQCRPAFLDAEFRMSGGSGGNSLADMVPSLHLDETDDQNLFTDGWWAEIIQRLDPHLIKDKTLTESFLQGHVPGYRPLSSDSAKTSATDDDSAPEMDVLSSVVDLNFCDSLRPRGLDTPRSQTPQTPVQLSPVRSSSIPMQPHLRNLPTPQTTPRITDGTHTPAPSRSILRCSASLDALRSMRRHCIASANVDRCPPPRSQTYSLCDSRPLARPAETIQEVPSRSTTPSMSSPASVASDATTSTSRSRSSSVSSASSWSTCSSILPRIRGAGAGQFSSPLAQVSSLSSRHTNPASAEKSCDNVNNRFSDEGYASSEEAFARSRGFFRDGSETAAARVLLSLSSRSDTSSQSATPTPQNYTLPRKENVHESPRGHKRSLSKSDCVQHYVRTIMRDSLSGNVTEETQSAYDLSPKQLQEGTKFWAASRRAIPNNVDSKRMALHCARQHASAPDLAAQYLLQQYQMTAS